MKKLFLLLLCLIFTLSACGGDTNEGLGSALGELATQNMASQSTVQSDAQSTQTQNSEPLPPAQEQPSFENPNNIDYGPYNSLVYAYRRSITYNYGELTSEYNGHFYANLVDFNADGVYELVISRVYDDHLNIDAQYDIASEQFIGNPKYPAVHVYYLKEDGSIGYAHETSFVSYLDEGMRFNIEYSTVNGETNLAFGGDMIDFGITSSEYVYSIGYANFNGEVFNQNVIFAIGHDYVNSGYEPTAYYINMSEVSKDEFYAEYDKYTENNIVHTVVGVGYETNNTQVTQNTIDFLSTFERANTVSDVFIYNNGNFLLYEQEYFTNSYYILKHYLDNVVLENYDALAQITENMNIIETVKSEREAGMYYPGLIIDEMYYIEPENYNEEVPFLMGDIYENTQKQILNTFVLEVPSKEVIDMQTVEYAGQFGGDVTYYYMFETDDNGENAKLLAIFNSHYY